MSSASSTVCGGMANTMQVRAVAQHSGRRSATSRLLFVNLLVNIRVGCLRNHLLHVPLGRGLLDRLVHSLRSLVERQSRLQCAAENPENTIQHEEYNEQVLQHHEKGKPIRRMACQIPDRIEDEC